MKRIAILIGSPLSEDNPSHLSGVNYDIKNYYNFLLSSTGGAWSKDEIIYLKNPTSIELQNVGKQCRSFEYTFVYYSGHGFYAPNIDDQFLNLNENEKVSAKAFLNFSPKQITIFDACRVFSDWSNFIGEIDTPSLIYDYQNASIAREYYHERIDQIQKGQAVLFSTQKGNYSYEEKNKGGFFSSSILLAASKFAQYEQNGRILSIHDAFEYSKEIIRTEYSAKQVPEIIKSNFDALLLPFAVQPYPRIQPQYSRIEPSLKSTVVSDDDSWKWVLGAAVVLGIALIIGGVFSGKK